jgi:hypothetical protein
MVISILLMLVFTPLLSVILEVSNRIGQKIFANSPDLLPQFTSDEAISDLRNTGQDNLNLLAGLVERSKGAMMLAILAGVIILTLVLILWKPWERRLRSEEGISSTAEKVHRSKRQTEAQERPMFLTNARRWLAAARIRNVYAQLMDLCARLGHPRPPAVTPLEFVPFMDGLFPDSRSDLEAITNAYLKVRYGELPETREEVQAVLDSWARIRKMGRLLRVQMKNSKAAASK